MASWSDEGSRYRDRMRDGDELAARVAAGASVAWTQVPHGAICVYVILPGAHSPGGVVAAVRSDDPRPTPWSVSALSPGDLVYVTPPVEQGSAMSALLYRPMHWTHDSLETLQAEIGRAPVMAPRANLGADGPVKPSWLAVFGRAVWRFLTTPQPIRPPSDSSQAQRQVLPTSPGRGDSGQPPSSQATYDRVEIPARDLRPGDWVFAVWWYRVERVYFSFDNSWVHVRVADAATPQLNFPIQASATIRPRA